MCITNPLKISDFQGNLLHMLLFSQKHAFYFSILRIKEGLSHVQQPLFLISSTAVQNQQNSRFNVGLYGLVVVLRLNTHFQLRYFIFCTTKIAVLSFVFLGVPFDFFISIEGRFLRCGTTTLERCSTQLNLF